MNKLIEKFDNILFYNLTEASDSEVCAEEAKKLALKFYEWMIVSPDFRYDIEIRGDNNDYFNLFIDQYYA